MKLDLLNGLIFGCILFLFSETSVPGKPTSLRVRPMTNSIVVSWTPPMEQDIMIRGYILGYGIGIPDVFRQVLDARQRYYTVKSLSTFSSRFHSLVDERVVEIFFRDQYDGEILFRDQSSFLVVNYKLFLI